MKSKNIYKLEELVSNKFTQEHVKIYDQFFKDFWESTEPEFFGESLHRAIRFNGFKILKISDLFFNQTHRAGSKNLKYVEIKQNIERNGYKMKYIPPCVLFYGNNFEVLTGNTRLQILAEMGVEEVVICEYVVKPEFAGKDSIIKEAILESGQTFNTSHDPSSPPSQASILRALSSLCELYQTSKGEAGVNPSDVDALLERVDILCGKGIFQPQTRFKLAMEVRNNFSPSDIIVAWQDNKNARYRLKDYLERYKFINNDKVEYMFAATSSPAKAWSRALELHEQFPNKEIRIVAHTSVLEGFDYENIYKNRIRYFYDMINRYKSLTVSVCGGRRDVLDSKIKVYGAFPAISSIHNLEMPLYFNVKTKTLYQKDGWVFDLDADDEVLADVA